MPARLVPILRGAVPNDGPLLLASQRQALGAAVRDIGAVAAWNGSRVGTVWIAGAEGDMNVMFQAFDRLGNPLFEPTAVRSSDEITTDGSVVYGPRLAAAGDGFAVLWSERIDSTPAAGQPHLQALWTDEGFVALRGAGSGRDAEGGEVHCVRLDESGTPVADGVLDPPAAGDLPYLRPAVWNRGNMVLLWAAHGATGLTLSRYATSGARVGDSIGIDTERVPGRLYLATSGREYGFIWSEEWSAEDGNRYLVYFQRATFCD